MATVKQYVDLDGLSKFKELLVGKYTDGTYKVMTATNATNAEIATNYKTADGSASIKDALALKADSTKLTEEVNKLVPKATTIAGVNLQDNITAAELIDALDTSDASKKIVNVIETVKVKNNGETVFSPLTVSNKAVEIDLSNYAKVSDITAVLKFKGVKGTFDELKTVENPSVGDVWIVTEGAEYAEYVYVDTNGDTDGGYNWEKLGVGVDLSGYYTSTQTDSAISTAVGNAKTAIENAYKKADTALQNTLQGKIDALYKVDGENVTGIIATRISAVETKANANEEEISTLNGDENTTGSVAKAIKDKIDALDSSSSMASDSDTKGSYVYSVNQTDGKVAVKTASFSGAVDSEDTNAVTGGAVANYVTGEIAKLDVTDIGSAGSFISVVGETDGKISATATAFVSSVKAETTDTDDVASNEYAVRQAIDGAYEMIASIPLEGKYGSIASLFTLISKTRDFITGTTEVAESDSVTSIADYAFYNYNTLTSVSFPVATSIGYQSFYGCSALTSVSFPEATRIGNYAFQNCIGLTEVSFPKATSIGQYAFQDCSSLTSVSFPLATSIGGDAFQSCEGLISISFPEVISIDTWAFYGCSSLTSVSFPKATSIGERAFEYCRGLTEVSFPEATSTGEKAFYQCNKLTRVSFPNATSIGNYAFEYCSNLTSVSFPNATSIGSEAFYECIGLTEVSFPVVTSIGKSAFYKCSGLTSVSFPVTPSIGEYAFRDCSSLTEVSIPEVTSIGSYAFNGCSSLTEVSFPLATSIGDNAFNGCSSLTSVSFPVASSIGTYAFQDCSSLTSASLPVATKIGYQTFYGCSALTTLYIGTELDTICTLSYTNAIPSSVTDIYVPYSLVDSYKSATNWSSFASKIKADKEPVECISLSITADDVVGNETSTTIHYKAECTYTKEGILQEGTTVFTGKATSDSFEQNTSMTDTVQRTVSFTFMGKTATTTITQGVRPKSITVTTSGISSYGWVTADSKYNVDKDKYDVYMSNNKRAGNSQAVMKLECAGYTDLTLYIRSYAEGNWDYTIASKANATTYPTTYNSSSTKASTRGNQKSGTSLSDYTAVHYTGLSGNDIIYIVFTKDSSGDVGDDRGYVLIPKQA